eukprot:14638206-Alexandrium_andersonii.AAC.1
MSASLVGSEMCIRDRSPEHGACRNTVLPECSLAEFGTGHVQAIDSTGAVSYTHLTLPTICSV